MNSADRMFEYFPTPDPDLNGYGVPFYGTPCHRFTMWIVRDEYQDLKQWCVDNGLAVRIRTYLDDDFHMEVKTPDANKAMMFKLAWA